MLLKIGEKIKELREKKNITQNKMAEYLGITEQAISRWENCGGYPDMELIPAISNFLDVSTDELFETDKKAERLRSLSSEAWKIHGWDYNSCRRRIDIYRNILKEFPNDYNTMVSLRTALVHDNENPLKHCEEIIALCNRIIKDSHDIDMRKSAIYSLALQYKNMGEQEKAVKMIKESPIIHSLRDGIFHSREYMLSFVAEGEEARGNCIDLIQTLHDELCNSIGNNLICMEGSSLHNNDISNEEWLELLKRQTIIIEKLNKLIEIFYEDGDYAFAREGMVYHYRNLVDYYMIFGEHDKALDNIEKCAETAIIFDTEKPGAHTSVLVKGIKIYGDYALENWGNHTENIKYNQSYRLIHDWFLSETPQITVPVGEKREKISMYEFYTPIRETERFKAVIVNLEKYAKIESE